MKKDRQGFDSLAIKDHIESSQAHIPPIYATSTFAYESPAKIMEVFKGKEKAYVYSRWNNPNLELVEEKISRMETFGSAELEAQSYLFSSGMAAISSLLHACLKPGDCVITQGNLYGTTTELLHSMVDQLEIELELLDMHDLDRLEQLLKQKKHAQMVYLETPSNPTINAYDISAISSMAHQFNCKVAVDNTFSTPYLQRPLQHGADFVVHSATKFLNGHGTALSGVVVSKDIEFAKSKIWKSRKLFGGVCAPFDAWLLNNGLKTLSLRMDRHCDNANRVASFLEGHKAVSVVNHLGLPSHPDREIAGRQMDQYGGVLSFELKDGLAAGMEVMNKIRFCTLTASLGTPDTLICHPASMTHVNVPEAQRSAYGISDGLIRMSVGLENPEDIITDLEQSLGL